MIPIPRRHVLCGLLLPLATLIPSAISRAQSVQPAARAEDPLAAVKAADLAMARAVLERDVPAFKAFLTADALFLGVPGRGPAAIAEGWSAFLIEKRRALLQWQPKDGAVSAAVDLAFTTGEYRMERTGPDGKTATGTGHYLTFWQRGDDGAWRVLADGSRAEVNGGPQALLAAIWPPGAEPDSESTLRRRVLSSHVARSEDLRLAIVELEATAGARRARGPAFSVYRREPGGAWKLTIEALGPLIDEP
jgi:ketosteroid isomerase-like protein